MSLYSLKPDPVVGIDISSTAIKLVELSRAGKGYRVESYVMEPLPENTIQSGSIDTDKMEIVGEAISRAVKRAKPRAQHAAVAVAGAAVITKTIIMDAGLSDADMREQIESDQTTYLGIKDNEDEDNEVNFDFQVIGPNERDPDRSDVLLAACFSETLDARVTALELGGLKTKVVDIEKYALENALTMVLKNDPEIQSGETIALIEVGANTTTMNVLGEQKIVYTQEEIFGGKQLTETIQSNYELSYEEANIAKRNGGLPDNYEAEVLEPFKEEMSQQISRMVQFYYAQSSYGKLSHILIAGGCASIPGIIEQVNNKVGGHISIINPFASMSVASRVSKKDLMNDAPALMIACGLALRTFDEY